MRLGVFEGAYASQQMKLWCDRIGVEIRTDCTGQHSTLGVVDRRIALVKDIARKIITECALHGFDITLWEAVCLACDATNELLEIGGYSCYQRAYGRQPRRLSNFSDLSGAT